MKRKNVSMAEARRMREMHAAGLNLREIGRKLGRDRHTVRYHIEPEAFREQKRAAGRKPPEQHKPLRQGRPVTAADVRRFRAMYEAGATLSAIAKHFGRGRETVAFYIAYDDEQREAVRRANRERARRIRPSADVEASS